MTEKIAGLLEEISPMVGGDHQKFIDAVRIYEETQEEAPEVLQAVEEAWKKRAKTTRDVVSNSFWTVVTYGLSLREEAAWLERYQSARKHARTVVIVSMVQAADSRHKKILQKANLLPYQIRQRREKMNEKLHACIDAILEL